jgi:ribosomal protein S18 acetylase RimI-like enzyme
MHLDPIKAAPTDTRETVTLRRATIADASALALAGAATFLEAFTWMLPGPDIILHAANNHNVAAYENYLADPNTRITLALSSPATDFSDQPGAPVGYALLTTPDLPTLDVRPSDIELKRIYLFSRFRSVPVLDPAGQPIPNLRPAQALMDAAIADARSLHRTRLLLGTHANNLRAIAFYRRNRFTEVGSRTFQVGTQVCYDLIFAKPL